MKQSFTSNYSANASKARQILQLDSLSNIVSIDLDVVRISYYRKHAVHRCGLLLQMSHVAWSVCLSVCWSYGFAVQSSWYDRDAILGGNWLMWVVRWLVQTFQWPDAHNSPGKSLVTSLSTNWSSKVTLVGATDGCGDCMQDTSSVQICINIHDVCNNNKRLCAAINRRSDCGARIVLEIRLLTDYVCVVSVSRRRMT